MDDIKSWDDVLDAAQEAYRQLGRIEVYLLKFKKDELRPEDAFRLGHAHGKIIQIAESLETFSSIIGGMRTDFKPTKEE